MKPSQRSPSAGLWYRKGDGRPTHPLVSNGLDRAAIASGLTAMLFFPPLLGALGLAVGVALTMLLTALGPSVASAVPEPAEPAIREEEVLAARFVQLGREFRPDEMPNRQVPRLSTKAPRPSPVPTKTAPRQPPPPDAGTPPPDAVEDLLDRIGDRASAFAEIADAREREGSPEGIEEGTESAREGDLYRGRLYAFFRRGWSVPSTLDADEVQALTTAVDLEIGANLRVGGATLRGSGSGNPVFDRSVVDHLTRLAASGATIPPPPEDVADQYLGQTIALRFRGRDAR